MFHDQHDHPREFSIILRDLFKLAVKQKHARQFVEQAFGRLKLAFPFLTVLRMETKSLICSAVATCIALHNFRIEGQKQPRALNQNEPMDYLTLHDKTAHLELIHNLAMELMDSQQA